MVSTTIQVTIPNAAKTMGHKKSFDSRSKGVQKLPSSCASAQKYVVIDQNMRVCAGWLCINIYIYISYDIDCADSVLLTFGATQVSHMYFSSNPNLRQLNASYHLSASLLTGRCRSPIQLAGALRDVNDRWMPGLEAWNNFRGSHDGEQMNVMDLRPNG